MLADLLSPANYIMVNRDAIRIFGLNTAVYCSELLTIYKKVVTKKKFVNDENFFIVDRNYIQKQTSLDVTEQLKCDINLAKVNIIKISEDNPNVIYFDIEVFGSVLASEDIKVLESVSSKVKVSKTKGISSSEKEYTIQKLKESIECKNSQVLFKLRDWIDTIYAAGKGVSKAQVRLFKSKLDDYCAGDVQKALKIIDIAIVRAFLDCQWAINEYEKETKTRSTPVNLINRVSFNAVNSQTKTLKVSEESF